jgi:hypothetical protein
MTGGKLIYGLTLAIFLVLFTILLALPLIPIVILLLIAGELSRIGGVNVKNPVSSALDRMQISEVRDDVVDIVSEETDTESNEDEVDSELRELLETGKRRQEHGELVFSGLLATAFVVSELYKIQMIKMLPAYLREWHIEIALFVLTVTIFVRVTMVERVAYSGISEVKTDDYETAISWQKAITKVPIVAALFFSMGLVRAFVSDEKYEFSMNFLETLDDMGVYD